jgi:hypothetical protein
MVTARRLEALLSALALAGLAPAAAGAEPQASAGLTAGVAGRGLDRAVWDQTVFHGGLRGDVLFGRSSNRSFGVGPYAEVLTHAFDEIQFGAGVSTLLPVLDTFPLVLSAGVYGRTGEDAFGVNPGVAATLFWGSRSYNFHANYGMAGGLLAEMRLGLGDARETSVVLGAQLDLALMAMPVVFLVNALKRSPETAPLAGSYRPKPFR